MSECANMLCDQPAKKKGLCSTHYGRMMYGRVGPQTTMDELCQAGLNRECVDCGETPFGGGRRCLPCFQVRAEQNRGEHVASEPPSSGTYSSGCRCRDCKDAAAEYTRQLRARRKVAA
jgi:hypothetical protein